MRFRVRPVLVVLLALAAILWLEASTGAVESRLLAAASSRLRYRVGAGASGSIAFPLGGPLDEVRGFARIPDFARALESHGYRVQEQARFSPALLSLSRLGVPMPFRDDPVAGLVITGVRGGTLFDATRHRHVFGSHAEIPLAVARSLLYIENRRLQSDPIPTQNPALDWGRLVKATGLWVGRHLGLPLHVEGASTLAVQLVKYHHGDEGRTRSPLDKLRQIVAASLEAYSDGPDTRTQRQQFVLDYLNTMPLAATPRHGEVSGLGDGLWVWFGRDPAEVFAQLERGVTPAARARAYKPILALLCAAQAPSRNLVRDRAGLERRVDAFTRRFARAGVIDPSLAQATLATRLVFAPLAATHAGGFLAAHKPTYAIRRELSAMLGIHDFYTLDRLDLRVQSTLDDSLQAQGLRLFDRLADPEFVRAQGLAGPHLLATGDPARVRYSLLLYESDPDGDRELAHVDNLDAPFDLNSGMKLELGSTAKLRTLADYLQIVEAMHRELAPLDPDSLHRRAAVARDPLTAWAAATLAADPGASLDTLLARALERRYSASPNEAFFTGGGVLAFGNFDPADNRRILTVHEAAEHSTNLVFIRLMRDIVRWQEARLPYDVDAVMSDPTHPDRRRLLEAAARQEARLILWRAWSAFRGDSAAQLESRFLGADPPPRRAASLFFAWHPGIAPDSLAGHLVERYPGLDPAAIGALQRMYGNPRFTLLDYAYLLGRHPLELWAAGEVARNPGAPWDSVWSRSAGARELCAQWLYDTRHTGAQTRRLRIGIEREAFQRITASWRALGFPFDHLVPSYATAIGSSGDRPVALAELMGTILADGVRRPARNVEQLVFAGGTPYHTALAPDAHHGERLLSVPVARALRALLADVVRFGTARRVYGAFTAPDRTPLTVGGKTGSGDNRFDSFARGGRLISSDARSRTAAFVFYFGDRHYGVITAAVMDSAAARYSFTSALPLAVLRLLAPAISEASARSARHPGPAPAKTVGPRPEPPRAVAGLWGAQRTGLVRRHPAIGDGARSGSAEAAPGRALAVR